MFTVKNVNFVINKKAFSNGQFKTL